MSRWPSEAFTLARARLRTAFKPAAVFVGGATLAEARAQFEAWARAHAGSVCEIGLGGAWVHACVVPPELAGEAGGGRADDAALRDYARLQFEHYFGAAQGAGWRLAASRDARAALVCAVAAELIDTLRAVAASHRVRVQRVAPWWARGAQAALREALQDAGATCVAAAVEPGRTTLLLARDGRIARVIGEPSAAPQDWRARLVGSAAATVPALLHRFELGDAAAQAQALRGQIEPLAAATPFEVAA